MKPFTFLIVGLGAAAIVGCPGESSDDDVPPSGTLQFSNGGYIVGESWGTASITVTRQGGSARAVSVLVGIAGGTATSGADYPVYVGYVASLHWTDGDASDKVVSFSLIDDGLLEGAETVDLALGLFQGATPGSTVSATLTIVDNENAESGSLQFEAADFSAGESDGLTTLSVTRTGGSVGSVSVQVFVSSGTATLGTDVPQWIDYVAELSWPDGDASIRTFDVSILDDATPEAAETVQFILLYPTGGASLGSTSDTLLTILDND